MRPEARAEGTTKGLGRRINFRTLSVQKHVRGSQFPVGSADYFSRVLRYSRALWGLNPRNLRYSRALLGLSPRILRYSRALVGLNLRNLRYSRALLGVNLRNLRYSRALLGLNPRNLRYSRFPVKPSAWVLFVVPGLRPSTGGYFLGGRRINFLVIYVLLGGRRINFLVIYVLLMGRRINSS